MYRSEKLWKRVRDSVLKSGMSIRKVARKEGISPGTVRRILRYEKPVGYRCKSIEVEVENKPKKAATKKVNPKDRLIAWHQLLDNIYRRDCKAITDAAPDIPQDLLRYIIPNTTSKGIKALVVLCHKCGFSNNQIAELLDLSRCTIRKHVSNFENLGVDGLFSKVLRRRLEGDEKVVGAVISLLHEPPSLHGFNRISWRLTDLEVTLKSQGVMVGYHVIRAILKNTGYRWRSAKVVLTSTDPNYNEKLGKIQDILSNLRADELFFSIDEYGPFSIKMKPGRLLCAESEYPSVPQWQKSKGWLILTAALELSHNQVTHFYSRAKNTKEMIKMAHRLIDQYQGYRVIYLSWDAASWHMSKALNKFIDDHNDMIGDTGMPRIELAPLPSSAQFLNVIESVFSGMSRAIIHNSNYQTLEEAKSAIDRYFKDRNEYYNEHHRHAGNKIWGKERSEPKFCVSGSFKDPRYR